jgi:hypothetical protein
MRIWRYFWGLTGVIAGVLASAYLMYLVVLACIFVGLGWLILAVLGAVSVSSGEAMTAIGALIFILSLGGIVVGFLKAAIRPFN